MSECESLIVGVCARERRIMRMCALCACEEHGTCQMSTEGRDRQTTSVCAHEGAGKAKVAKPAGGEA